MRRTTRALPNKTGETDQLGLLQPGVTLQDRYLILGVLGSGGMSSVYKGRDLHFPNVTKLVAVKEMINLAADPTMYEMVVRNFEREADLLATLSHPAIPRIYDYFTQDTSSYLVMEFIDGRDLERLLGDTDTFLPEEKIVTWAVELCDVLTYLHGHQPQPVIFRDMKPSNVMIDQHGHIRLIDFGIARIFQPGQKGTMIGTEGYSPPEQYRGEASPAGDIYALGATMHHLLTRRDPRAEPPFSFSERPVRQINPQISPELESVVNAALAYDPKDRFASAECLQVRFAGRRQTDRHPDLASEVHRSQAPLGCAGAVVVRVRGRDSRITHRPPRHSVRGMLRQQPLRTGCQARHVPMEVPDRRRHPHSPGSQRGSRLRRIGRPSAARGQRRSGQAGVDLPGRGAHPILPHAV